MMKRNRSTIFILPLRRAFTLTEALLAIGLLLVILLFVGRIFGTVNNVSTAGAANMDVMQEVASIERQMRADFERVSRDGFLVIVSTAVRNDINDATSSNPDLWLDPTREFDAFIRSDRLLFFTQGAQGVQVFRSGQGASRKPQSSESRVYYGHGFQVGDPDGDPLTAEDVVASFGDLPPWYVGPVDFEDFANGGTSLGSIDIGRTGARSWTLARQNILLSDDGGGQEVFGSGQASSVVHIWNNFIRNARVDAAAWQLNDIRGWVFDSAYEDRNTFVPNPRNWLDMRAVMLDSVFYPRAERQAQSTSRGDHATTINTLGTGVSDFIVEWSYPPGLAVNGTSVGYAVNQNNEVFGGVSIASSGRMPWFGLPDALIRANSDNPADPSTLMRGSFLLGDQEWWTVDSNGPVFPTEFENVQTLAGGRIIQYAAVFGYNQTRPLDDRAASSTFGEPWTTGAAGIEAYTPWPSAIRITMRVHDPNVVLEAGREVQFILNLPRRNR